jgi:hypothetical protein
MSERSGNETNAGRWMSVEALDQVALPVAQQKIANLALAAVDDGGIRAFFPLAAGDLIKSRSGEFIGE